MKRFIIIAAAASVFASCAVTKTHSARTATVRSEITQMPTVVELDVAGAYSGAYPFTFQLPIRYKNSL